MKAPRRVIRQYGVEVQAAAAEKKAASGWKTKIARNRLVQKIAYWLYERMFKIINA